jgi:glyoxylase-like metal-dependent hydrolase (beta-lactamase superfamily II)
MMKQVIFSMILALACLWTSGQDSAEYRVYAIKFIQGYNFPATEVAVGAQPEDSVQVCNMFWLLRDGKGRNIMVDAGYIDASSQPKGHYIRPDLMLGRLNLEADDISDIILTHPHSDHAGGLRLFPKATVWMQKKDYDYFVSAAWQENGFSRGFDKSDVRELLEINLQGRLKLVDGDDLEIIPGIKVFTGSKHTFENQYLLVNPSSTTDKILLASDAIWFYYNFDHMLPVKTYAFDPKAYVDAMKRMKTLVKDEKLIVPGHDDLVFTKFPEVAEGIVRITGGRNQ